MKHKIIPIFIPHEGCPHDCSFCNQKRIAGVVKAPDQDSILETVQRYRGTNLEEDVSFTLAYYGGSFTAIDSQRQILLLELAKKLRESGEIHCIRVSTRPDYLKQDHVKRLVEYGVDYVEIGVQSTDPQVLNLASRYYDLKVLQDAVDTLKKNDIGYGVQMMVGLPGDNEEKVYHTTVDLVGLHPGSIRIYPCLVLADTLLEEWYREGTYRPLEVREAVEQAMIPYVFFTNRKIPVIRMGLHPSESLQDPKSLIAGPFHPSFGEMVISSIYKSMLLSWIQDLQIPKGTLQIGGDKRKHSQIVGNRSYVFKEIFLETEVKLELSHVSGLGNDLEIQWDGKANRLSFEEQMKRLEVSYTRKYNTRM